MAAPAASRERHPPVTVDVLRGPALESRHVVYGVLWNGAGGTGTGGAASTTWGDPDLVTYMRSALKPFQVLPLLVDGVAERLGVTDAEIALACGSHSGQREHLEVLHRLMELGGVRPADLQCGRHRPYHKEAARALGDGYTAEHNNCSGKHAAMVAWCRAQDVDPAGYLDPGHPLQRRILDLVALFTGIPRQDIPVAVDGCGVPTVGLPLAVMAQMFLVLGDPERFRHTRPAASLPAQEVDGLVAALDRTRRAMQEHPLLVAGEERADTDMGVATAGRVVAKAGAEGVWCGVDVKAKVAFAVKAVDGHFRAAVPAALEVLGAAGLLDEAELATLERHHRPAVKNHVGRTVGQIVPHLP